MLNKLRIVGENIIKHEGSTNELQLDQSLNQGNVIALDLLLQSDSVIYRGTDISEFDQQINQRVLLKPAKAQAKSEFPTYRVAFNSDPDEQRKNIIKTMTKLYATLEQAATIENIAPQIRLLLNFLQTRREEIIEDIKKSLMPEISNILTLKINNLFPAESPVFEPVIQRFLDDVNQNYYRKYGTESKGSNNSCYLCGRVSSVTYGFCDTYKFYSANELAYIAGGFKKEDSWKNYPVCPTCASQLRAGKELIDKHFNRYFYGSNYLMIPAPTIGNDGFYQVLNDIKKDYTEISLRQKQEKNEKRRLEMEEEIFEVFGEQKDQVTSTFLFYKEQQSEFKILQEVEEILPSRFKTIITAKKWVENFDEFKNLTGLYEKKQVDDLKFNFGIIKTFFSSEYNNDFLEITARIMRNKPLSREFLLRQIMKVIAEKFRQEKMFYIVPQAMILLKFLYKLKLISNPKYKMEVNMESKYEDYFQTHPDFYDADWKKAVFLLGVLAQNVLDIQYQERKSTPFRDRLNGLKIDYHVIKRLLPECINKLEQYSKNYYRELEETISIYQESGEPDLRIQSVDEISFYFAMGMNRNKQFKVTNEKEGEE